MGHHTCSSRALRLVGLACLALSGACSRRVEPRARLAGIGFYRPSQGAFFFLPCGAPCLPTYYGPRYVRPVVGDWNGAGIDSIGIYGGGGFALTIDRGASLAQLYVIYENAGVDAIGVTGDWNGDGITTTGIYSPSRGRFYLRNRNDQAPPFEVAFGEPGQPWIPVVGDWNGSGRAEVGLYDPEEGVFHLRIDNADVVRSFGGPHMLPLAGDWQGKGHDDVGVFDRARGVLLLRLDESRRFRVDVGNRPLDVPLAGHWWMPNNQGDFVSHPR